MRSRSSCGIAMVACLFACSNAVGEMPEPEDAIVERVFQPAETAYAVLTENLRDDPEFYWAYKRLGERRCLVYLDAWKQAFGESMPEVRKAYYAAFREAYPSERLKAFEGLKLDGAGRGALSFRAHNIVMSGPGKAHMESMKTSVLTYMKVKAREASSPTRDDELIAELETGRSKVCGLTAEMIEGQMKGPVGNAQ